MKKFYIANSIPYVNAKPHIGHALEFIQSDVIARFHRLIGDETLLLCGGDENALKNVQAAEQAGIQIQQFVDTNTQAFYDLSKKLNVQFDVWQKGSDAKHHTSSQKLWELCSKHGYIDKRNYTGLYCVGCELFYEAGELNENQECFEHPGRKLDEVSEENYFFKLSEFQQELEKIIATDQIIIIPSHRKQEVLSFLKAGLKDISISRSNARAKNWGVPVPGDNSQRMYVWFDALNIYHSGIGFGTEEKKFKKWSPVNLHVIGKGILRFHAVYWPAFLLAAELPLPKSIFVHEYITVNGQKMSKTLGNVIDPNVLIEKYGADAVRYYLLAKISPFSDGDFSEEKFKEVYNADLANGLGNLVARVAKLCESIELENELKSSSVTFSNLKKGGYYEHIQHFEFNLALEEIWREIKDIDVFINIKQPWKQEVSERKKTLLEILPKVIAIVKALELFLPETAQKIQQQFKGPIRSQKPLFPRLA